MNIFKFSIKSPKISKSQIIFIFGFNKKFFLLYQLKYLLKLITHLINQFIVRDFIIVINLFQE